jgi:5-methyltetrahydrofolate--homocysteine methyltransferase
VLTCDDDGIPATVEKRLEILDRLIEMTRKGGLSDNKLHVVPLVGTISTSTESGNMAFDAMRQIKKKYPDVHITGGLSNISFGLPARSM